MRFYVDSSIWIDLYEDRKGYKNALLGDFALKFFILMKSRKDKLVISDILITELNVYYSIEQINGMLMPFQELVERIISVKEQRYEAEKIADERYLPPGDVLHAILARDYNLILVTRDKHFNDLKDICPHHKPEELI